MIISNNYVICNRIACSYVSAKKIADALIIVGADKDEEK